ncbi:MAG: aminoacyl-histidine dipeptidase [Bacteroidales bacterium]|nr:aminoacyl-histidine dipeptidase [Bacteroidales bacterium]
MERYKSNNSKSLWNFFEKILSIPHPSHAEDRLIAYIQQFAIEHNFEYKSDKVGNLLVIKPANSGYENYPAIMLQGHCDMVCEKNKDNNFNFYNDKIDFEVVDNKMKANGTTLGADDGIGVASMLAILDNKDLKTGKIGCLFTVCEEVGLYGAKNLDKSLLNNFDTLINLDSEEHGIFYIGCAGGLGTNAYFNYNSENIQENYIYRKIAVKGLSGGHSGSDIHLNRGNAIIILNRLLWLFQKKSEYKLCYINGGNLRNAIPRECEAIIAISPKVEKSFEKIFNYYKIDIEGRFSKTDPNIEVSFLPIEPIKTSIDDNTRRGIICSLRACPNGVISWCKDIKNVVETSTNIASIKMLENNKIEIITTQRSCNKNEKQTIGERIETLFTMGGAEVIHNNEYPGWQPNIKSPILNKAINIYKNMFNETPKVTTIHAGLECGLFYSYKKDLDIISFGPTITGVHSPDETLYVDTVEKYWNLLINVITEI